MLRQTAIGSGIAVVAGVFIACGVAIYGIDALRSPEMSVAALILTIFGIGWLR